MTAPTAEERRLIDAYLDAIVRRLPRGGAPRRAVIDELCDGLLEARCAHLRSASNPVEATQNAIAEFGPPELVAATLAPEMSVRQARRAGWWVILALLTAGLTWQAFYTWIGVSDSMVPETPGQRQAFFVLTTTIKLVPGLTQLAAGALVIGAIRAGSDAASTKWVRWVSAVATVLLGAMLANMAGILLIGTPNRDAGASYLIAVPLVPIIVVAFITSLRCSVCCHRASASFAGSGVTSG